MTADEKREADINLDVPPEFLAAAQASLPVERRIVLAQTVDRRAEESSLKDSDPLMLKRILGIIAMDAELRVRQALADVLAENPGAPHDIVLKLAQDDDLVASPLLRLAEILTPDDLLKILGTGISEPKMTAIADRRSVPDVVCLALIDKGNEDTAGHLLRNHGADIPEAGLTRIIDQHGALEEIQAAMVDRPALPATIMERVIALVSTELLGRLMERHAVSVDMAAKITLETRGHATLGLTSGMSSEAMSGLIEQLIAEDRLTHSLLLRSLCTGNLDFIIQVIATKARLGTPYVRSRLLQGTPAALAELWSKADLPTRLLPVTMAAVEILASSRIDGVKWGVAYYRQRIIERMITRCDELDAQFSDEDMTFLIEASRKTAAGVDDFRSGDAVIGA